jgi:hypothetical protein
VVDTAAGIVYLLCKHADVLCLARCEIKEENAKLEWTMTSIGNALRDLWKHCDGSCREGHVCVDKRNYWHAPPGHLEGGYLTG